jgi:hypothetical protein
MQISHNINTVLPADIFEEVVIHLRQSFHLLAKFHDALRYEKKVNFDK